MTTEQLKHFLAVKAICALGNTLQRIFNQLHADEVIYMPLVKPLLEDLSKRMTEVENTPAIDELHSKMENFINGISENTTNGQVAQILSDVHLIIDKIYWQVFEEIGIPHP